jgi:hypothetical protein
VLDRVLLLARDLLQLQVLNQALSPVHIPVLVRFQPLFLLAAVLSQRLAAVALNAARINAEGINAGKDDGYHGLTMTFTVLHL